MLQILINLSCIEGWTTAELLIIVRSCMYKVKTSSCTRMLAVTRGMYFTDYIHRYLASATKVHVFVHIRTLGTMHSVEGFVLKDHAGQSAVVLQLRHRLVLEL